MGWFLGETRSGRNFGREKATKSCSSKSIPCEPWPDPEIKVARQESGQGRTEKMETWACPWADLLAPAIIQSGSRTGPAGARGCALRDPRQPVSRAQARNKSYACAYRSLTTRKRRKPDLPTTLVTSATKRSGARTRPRSAREEAQTWAKKHHHGLTVPETEVSGDP
jgi:hypothetical protein